MDEFARIARYLAPLAGPEGLGLKDDAALLAPPDGQELVFTKDMLVEGVHFPRDCGAEVVAARALRSNLSDLAAMGAQPLGYLLGLALTDQQDTDWLDAFCAQLKADQETFSLHLWGGDSVRGDKDVTVSVTAVGCVPTGQALRRNGARVGDDIYVSGAIGAAGAGLRMAMSALEGGRPTWQQAYCSPEPRLALGAGLRNMATACADVSDGLLADLEHICSASETGADVRLEDLPIDPDLPGGALAAIAAGDDYELVFTASPHVASDVFTLGKALDVNISNIGRVVERRSVSLLDATGSPIDVPSGGWKHFK